MDIVLPVGGRSDFNLDSRRRIPLILKKNEVRLGSLVPFLDVVEGG